MGTFVYDGFEWDEKKAETNAAKHGLRFEEAAEIFSAAHYHAVFYHEESGEERHIAVGEWQDKIVTVIYVMRSGRRRLVSARRARKYEKNYYRERIGKSD